MRILMVLALIFCFSCGDNDSPAADAAVEAGVDATPLWDGGEGMGSDDAVIPEDVEVSEDVAVVDAAVPDMEIEDAQTE